MDRRPKIIGYGNTSIVTTVDSKTALKGYEVWWQGKRTGRLESCEDRIVREGTIYSHLGKHPRILEYFGLQEVSLGIHSLRLELAPLGCLRQFLLEHPQDIPSIRTRIQMTLDVTEGLRFMHSRGVINADLSTRNLFVFDGLRLKLGDFGASVLRERRDVFKLDQCYEGRYTLPPRGRKYDEVDIMKRELFALGCAIYEIMAWEVPFSSVTSDEAEQMYILEQFPSLDGNPARDVIQSCWAEAFTTTDEVACQLTRLFPSK